MPIGRNTYGVLPALSVRRAELRRSLRIVTIAWMYGVVWMTCIRGSHVILFVRKLGFTELDLGLIAAVPFAARVGQVIAALIIDRTGVRKRLFLYTMTVHRLCWLLIAAIPLLLPIPSRAAVVTMLVVLGVSWLLAMVGITGWLTWMGDLIPRRIRGRYLAVRSRLSQLVQIGVVIALGVLVDQVTAHGTETLVLVTIGGIFVAAAIFGTMDILLFRRIREVVPSTSDEPARPQIDLRLPRAAPGLVSGGAYALRYVHAVAREFLWVPLKDRAFRHFVGHAATLAIAMSVAGSFFFAYCLEDLHLGVLTVNTLYLIVAPLSAIFSAKLWGRLIDVWGRRPALVAANVCIVFSVMPYFFARPGWWAPLPVAISCTVGGSGWSGVMLAQMSIMLGFSDGPGRGRYVAGSSVIVGLGGFFGGWLGGTVASALSPLRADPLLVGPFVWNNRHATFALSMLARAAGLLWLIGLPDPGAVRVRELVRRVRSSIYANVMARLYYPFRLLMWRRSRRNDDGQQGRGGGA